MRRVRLTEGQLHRIIRNAVNEAVEDMSGDEDLEQRQRQNSRNTQKRRI